MPLKLPSHLPQGLWECMNRQMIVARSIFAVAQNELNIHCNSMVACSKDHGYMLGAEFPSRAHAELGSFIGATSTSGCKSDGKL